MTYEPVVPGVWGIPMQYVNAFLIADDGLTLIDSGLPGKRSKLVAAMGAAGGGPLRNVAITHHHMDHVGSLAKIIEGTAVTVWAHAADAAVIRGEVPPPVPPGRNVFERVAITGVKTFGPKAEPARVDREVADGEELPIAGGLIAYHTPGHTAGHLSFLLPSKRVLFVGDAAARMLGRLAPPLGVYTEDHEEVKRSIAKLAALDFDVACFGHGKVLKGGAAIAFRRLAEKVAR
ncbi:MAG TPA: MBL fold metallo-hydrolase [Actinomycetota bacterium]|nr:MBL fold metallo-hydrolase [Actinomycetota bacterium]